MAIDVISNLRVNFQVSGYIFFHFKFYVIFVCRCGVA